MDSEQKGDAPNETPQNIHPLIKEYEVLIATLTDQLEYYKKEQDVLKKDILTLLNENKQLSAYTKELLQKTDETISTLSNKKNTQGELIDNLKQQIDSLSAEKDSTMELWKTSLHTIDQLEDELRLYEGRTHGFVPKDNVKKMIINYEKIIKQLKMELSHSRESLAKIQQSSLENVDKKEEEIIKLNGFYQTSLNTINQLEGKINKMKGEMKLYKEKHFEIEQQFTTKLKTIKDLQMKEEQSKMKVNEAIQVVEAALNEKDAALLREQKIKEKMTELARNHSKEIEDIYIKLKDDIQMNNQSYNKKIQSLNEEIYKLRCDLQSKTAEVDSQMQTIYKLQENIKTLTERNIVLEKTSPLLAYERNFDSTFDKLLSSEKKIMQLENENQSVKNELTKMICMYEREVMTKETEKKILETKMSTLQGELDVSNKNMCEIVGKVTETNKKIGDLEEEMKQQFHLNNIKKDKLWTNRIREIEDKNLMINQELQTQLQSHISFNTKWKQEVKEIIRKLENRINQLKEEAKVLKCKNDDLCSKLVAAEQQIEIYKGRLMELCVDVKKIADVSREQSHTQFERQEKFNVGIDGKGEPHENAVL